MHQITNCVLYSAGLLIYYFPAFHGIYGIPQSAQSGRNGSRADAGTLCVLSLQQSDNNSLLTFCEKKYTKL